ncbi:hypothetical protein KR100_01945 [Synechococcus sp. KORDI-100]|nr:hypothetical protein KR100_01945 [Synechococcus sp. KORDI-100]
MPVSQSKTVQAGGGVPIALTQAYRRVYRTRGQLLLEVAPL